MFPRLAAPTSRILLSAFLAAACHRSPPPVRELADARPRTIEAPLPPPSAAASPASDAQIGASGRTASGGAAVDSERADQQERKEDAPQQPLVDATGAPLPQTEDRPSASSAAFQARLTLLVQAIAEDRPEVALPVFFPVEAYKQVKAIEKPERDWKARLVRAFERNVHEYHRELGSAASSARLVRVEIPDSKIKWMKPGSEGNAVGYFRVVRSRLVVRTSEREEIPLEITSLISWRGEWYVVHLHGFK